MDQIAMYLGYACIGLAGLLCGFTVLGWFFVLIWRWTGIKKMHDETHALLADYYSTIRQTKGDAR